MTRKEIHTKDNDSLIYELCQLMVTGEDKVLKSSLKTAKLICDELQERGVVQNAQKLFEKWQDRYLL